VVFCKANKRRILTFLCPNKKCIFGNFNVKKIATYYLFNKRVVNLLFFNLLNYGYFNEKGMKRLTVFNVIIDFVKF
jgi:hypothetical protein